MHNFCHFLHNWLTHNSNPIVWQESNQTGYTEWRIYDPVTGLLTGSGILRSTIKDTFC
ncbi:MAG TPA: hypothetical protein V6D10_18865 [Trichocoleus sp.]